MTHIKICGVRSTEIAAYCADRGASYIGLIFCQNSPRVVDLELGKLIAQTARTRNTIPVAVFTDTDVNTMINICEQTRITHVQLHGALSKQALHSLPDDLHKIYVMTPEENISALLPYLSTDKDFILLDSDTPGMGQPIDWHNIVPPQGFRFFLAGGLNADNVSQAIKMCAPYGVDVSSGVESKRGEKSPALITQFIATVDEVHHAK